MDDFKIGDDFDENGNVKEHNKVDKKIAIIIVVIIAIVIGLVVFFVSNAIFGGGGKEETPVDTEVALTDENVQILYKYVAYRENGDDKFLKEKSVQGDAFTDEEKMYYSLQFLQPSDLTYSNKDTEKKQKIYDLTLAKIRNYSQRFFGREVNINPVEKMTYRFKFSINTLSLATITYSDEEEVYKVVFEEEKETGKDGLIKPYYNELTSAIKKSDGTLVLSEKVIYTTSSKEESNYKINIYKDYEHTTLIEMKQNITEDDLKANPISIENYLDKAATITYTFKVNAVNRNYYFDNSSITY